MGFNRARFRVTCGRVLQYAIVVSLPDSEYVIFLDERVRRHRAEERDETEQGCRRVKLVLRHSTNNGQGVRM